MQSFEGTDYCAGPKELDYGNVSGQGVVAEAGGEYTNSARLQGSMMDGFHAVSTAMQAAYPAMSEAGYNAAKEAVRTYMRTAPGSG